MNNQKRDELCKMIDALHYRISEHRYNENLDADYMNQVGEQLRGYIEYLKYETFSCDENIDALAGRMQENVKQLGAALDAGLSSRVKSAAKDLSDNFTDLRNHRFDGGNPDENNPPKQSSSQRELSEKFEELESFKNYAITKKIALQKEKGELISEKKELEDKFNDEEDDDIANDLDRRISAKEEQISMKSALMGSYSNCATRLDTLLKTAKDLSDMGPDQLEEVNNLLSGDVMKRIRAALSDPNGLEIVCNKVLSDIKKVKDRTSQSDDRRAKQAPASSSTLTDGAKKRREALRNRKRQEEENANNMGPIDRALDEEKNTTVTQEVK